jgi:hypothetical protein
MSLGVAGDSSIPAVWKSITDVPKDDAIGNA